MGAAMATEKSMMVKLSLRQILDAKIEQCKASQAKYHHHDPAMYAYWEGRIDSYKMLRRRLPAKG
jgi:hypothetical protein